MEPDRCELLALDLPRAEELRAVQPGSRILDAAAAGAQALADPTRLSLALALRDGGELCGCDLAWIVGRSQSLVSHHLRALRTTGLACSRRVGKMVLYALTEDGERLVDALVPGRTGVVA